MIFRPIVPEIPWKGYCGRINGVESVFHVSQLGKIYVRWRDNVTAPMELTDAANLLAKRINEVKRRYAGLPGGGFQINEFGQVICFIRDSEQKYLVGTISGVPRFHCPRNPGSMFTLRPESHWAVGTPWPYPYLGIRHVFGDDGRIYRKYDSFKQPLECRNRDLEQRLRSLRRGGCRFIVNLHGAVFTKLPPDYDPVFVGFIDLDRWYPRES